MNIKKIQKYLATVIALGVVSHLSGKTLAYEGFNQAEVSGTGVAKEWSWKDQTAISNGYALDTSGLSFESIESNGISMKGVYFDNNLLFSNPISLTDGPIYVSFLVQIHERKLEYSTTFEAQAGVIDQDDRKIMAGITFSEGKTDALKLGGHLKADGYPGAYGLGEVDLGKTVLVIMRVSGSGVDADVEVWCFVDGAPPSELVAGGPRYGSYQAKNVKALKGFSLMCFGVDASFDELRVSTDYNDILK